MKEEIIVNAQININGVAQILRNFAATETGEGIAYGDSMLALAKILESTVIDLEKAAA